MLLLAVTATTVSPRAPADLLDEARILVETGACDGALPLLEQIIADHPASPQAPVALYEAGRCLEATEDLDGALLSYERVLTDYRESPQCTDARFRIGMLHAVSHRHREALAQFRQLRRGGAASTERERAVLGLQIGTIHAARGRPRPAIREIVPALEVLDGLDTRDDPEVAVYRSQAHVVLGDLASDAMQGISMDTPNATAQRRRLKLRAASMELASGHYRAAVDDEAVYWSCAAGFKMGLLNENQYHGVLAAPAPRGLNDEQSRVFLETLQDASVKFLEAARQTYRDTLAFAARTGASNRWTEAAADRLETMDLEPLMDRDGI